nr:putative na(+)/h(+) antiporter c3a11.09 [Quercus suber]
MVWDQIDINKPHLVYIILGGFTSLFMLCSSIIKERLYIGEATVATICGIIFGPHAAGLIDPGSWGNTDQITLEFSRIVLVVQCFAVGVELPKAYMERHWRSVTFLLVPVMTFGWLITSLFIWAVFTPAMNWLDCLCVAACVTATDPVLASSVVGKGKFAKRVPKHLRDLLSAESGCNDGMAFPFIYLALYLIRYRPDANQVALHWICITILYECVFGAVYGVMVGYAARRAIKYAHEKNYVDRESFLVFYFVLALFCAGSGSILGIDDLLVGFACGVGFSNDGWFTEKTEESHVSNVIDLLINLTFFVYFGTIIPWSSYNAGMLNLNVWRLVVVALLVLFFRRIPIMMVLKPVIPDIKTWREALFAGHFGPIGVGAIFVAILARGELETEFESTTPLEQLPAADFPHDNIIELIWPITTFLVLCSIIVHGSSIAVFTLGKHINTLTLTMSYTQGQEPSWMDRLPRIQSRSKSSMSMQRSDIDLEFDDKEKGIYPPGMQPPFGTTGPFLRRQREEDNPSRTQSRASSRHRSKRSRQWDAGVGPGGPISESAIKPARKAEPENEADFSRSDSETLAAKTDTPPSPDEQQDDTQVRGRGSNRDIDDGGAGEIYEEGDDTVYEDEEGNVLAVEESHEPHTRAGRMERMTSEEKEGRRLMHKEHADGNHGVAPTKDDPDHDPGEKAVEKVKETEEEAKETVERPGKAWRAGLNKMSTMTGFRKRDDAGEEGTGGEKKRKPPEEKRSHGPARAYQYGKTIIVEDEDGEVIKKYDIPGPERKGRSTDADRSHHRIGQMGRMLGLSGREMKTGKPDAAAGTSVAADADPHPDAQRAPDTQRAADEDDRLRFTIDAGGRRMSKVEFINQIRQMDPKARVQAVEESNVPEPVKRVARQEMREQGASKPSDDQSAVPVVRDEPSSSRNSPAALHPVKSHESGDLKLVDSNEDEIPFHDISGQLRKHKQQTSSGETAAERRRRQAFQQRQSSSTASAGGNNGNERTTPPLSRASGSAIKEQPKRQPQPRGNEVAETAAERRRREGALGIRSQDDTDSDSDAENLNEPRRIPSATSPDAGSHRSASQAQRGAGGAGTDAGGEGRPPQRHSTLRWGQNVGR